MAEKRKKEFRFFQILAEIGVVTIGILIAYQLNNWKEIRATRNAEEKMLLEIKANLQLDLIDLTGNRDAHEDALKFIDTLKIIAKTNVYSDTIPFLIRFSLRDFVFNAQTSAFETLKAKGIQLISNDSIRIRILRLYDFDYETIEKVEESYEPHQFTKHYQYLVLNYFDGFDLHKVDDIKPIYPGASWLLRPDVKNRLDLTKTEHNFALSLYNASISEVKSLVKTIDKEIENEF